MERPWVRRVAWQATSTGLKFPGDADRQRDVQPPELNEVLPTPDLDRFPSGDPSADCLKSGHRTLPTNKVSLALVRASGLLCGPPMTIRLRAVSVACVALAVPQRLSLPRADLIGL
jgi:hypothetical protein